MERTLESWHKLCPILLKKIYFKTIFVGSKAHCQFIRFARLEIKPISDFYLLVFCGVLCFLIFF